MSAGSAEMNYRTAAMQQATPAGLMVILYDLLTADLQRAIAAMEEGVIEGRSRYLKHALLVLQILQGSLDLSNGGTMEHSLWRFYAHLRTQIMAAQFRSDPAILQQQIVLILDVRGAWHQAEHQTPKPIADGLLASKRRESTAICLSPEAEGVSWSA